MEAVLAKRRGGGNDTENRYERAAQILLKRKKHHFAKYIRAAKNSDLDWNKIDALLVTTGSVGVGFQYKTSEIGVEAHYAGRRRKRRRKKQAAANYSPGCSFVMAICPPKENATDEELAHQLSREAYKAIYNPFQSPYDRRKRKK